MDIVAARVMYAWYCIWATEANGLPPRQKTGEEELIEEVMRENISIGEATLLQ